MGKRLGGWVLEREIWVEQEELYSNTSSRKKGSAVVNKGREFSSGIQGSRDGSGSVW